MVAFSDVVSARDALAGRLPVTPLWTYPAVNEVADATVYVKHENVQPVGAFKVRGGFTLLAAMPESRRRGGLVTWSTGNHAQSIAYACREFDVRCTIVMPVLTSEEKMRAVRVLGATVVLDGADLGAAQARAEQIVAEGNGHLVSPGDTPELVAGVGTAYMEVFEAVSDLDAVVVPIGSGTGAAAAAIVAGVMAPGCDVIGVQSTAAPAAYESWRSGTCVRRPARTVVDGLAVGRGYELPQRLMKGALADFLLVTDDQIVTAQRLMATHAHTLAEGAGAAGLAAVLAHPDTFRGRRVAVVCTGGNASSREIAALVSA
ncbi:threo-3-hydroxy-L-aspartate ammonia-lyase [Pseudonocardia ailaonensis]|uniref:Threo-3-hydroxy-L-aspartate ammonia-lyase n=1 Tax=Pseudonocardia ailaonensis TaxID=367279 RepID=A0ABN2NAH4_9PSEU